MAQQNKQPGGDAAADEKQAAINAAVQKATDSILADLQATQQQLQESKADAAELRKQVAALAKSADGVLFALKRPAQVGDKQRQPGFALGTIKTTPGVDVNYLVDAIRDGLAREVHGDK